MISEEHRLLILIISDDTTDVSLLFSFTILFRSNLWCDK